MATLPSCMYWTFTNSGLLIQDWLLKPVRPVNLNEAMNQLYLSSVIHSKNQFSNSNENFIDNSTDSIQYILQIIFYFSLPLIPAATTLFTLVNIFHESKYYTCPKYTLYTRPYIQRLSQYLIVFYVLTGINSSLIWLSSLPRYIPMSIGQYTTLTNYQIIDKNQLNTDLNSTHQYNTLSNMDIYNNNNNNSTPKFITQLPAMLTMQIVLRLTLCWLTIGLIIDRIYILGELYVNPMTKSFSHYVNYIYMLTKEKINENHYIKTMITNINNNYTNKSIIENTKINSIFQIFLKFIQKYCSIQKCTTIQSCPICKQTNYHIENEYICFFCKPNHLYNSNENKQTTLDNNNNDNLYLNNIMHYKRINCTSIGRLILIIGLLITCSLAICLPQVWSYHLIGINLKIKLYNNIHNTNKQHISNSNNDKEFIEKIYPAWRLINKTGQIIYEYCFAVISFVIPCCTIIVCLLILIIRLIKIKYEFQHIFLHNLNMKEIKFYKLYENIVKYSLNYLIQDCVIILILAIIQLCCSLPYLMTNSINRLECYCCLFGDFLIQLIILSVRLCETNHLITNNYTFQITEYNWLKKLNINRVNKQNYTIVQYQHENEHNDYEIEELMKTQELNEEVDDEDNCEISSHDDDDEVERLETHAYPMKTPTDSGQTSKNISPLPISHTISDVLLSPKFKSKHTMHRINVHHKTHRSSPSTFASPILQRIPENIKYHNDCNSFIAKTTMKTSINSYVEPKTNMASLTYSPRSRHPCRLQNKITESIKLSNNNNSNSNNKFQLSNSLSLVPSAKVMKSPDMSMKNIHQNRQTDDSPPPLPPPPKHLIYMLGGDSSIYSTPHGSPQPSNTRKQIMFNNNLPVDYSPNFLQMTHISKHESPNAASFRQTDSGVTGMGGSLIDSEHYEPNTLII
ncbi:unnamed protein product [Heterobilharzia americana]|nr:unnamed protein product [Heterobilharzia americana]